MYAEMFKKTELLFKPLNDIFLLNAEAFESLRERQATLMGGLIQDGWQYASKLAAQQSPTGVAETSKDYWDGLQEKLNASAQDNAELFVATQEKVGALIQNTLSVESESETFSFLSDLSSDQSKNAAKEVKKTKRAPVKRKASAKSTEAKKEGIEVVSVAGETAS